MTETDDAGNSNCRCVSASLTDNTAEHREFQWSLPQPAPIPTIRPKPGSPMVARREE